MKSGYYLVLSSFPIAGKVIPPSSKYPIYSFALNVTNIVHLLRDINDYTHLTVNHSLTFKDPESGAHTNTIEGLWFHAKGGCPRSNRQKAHFLGYLATFMLHRKWRNQPDSFSQFMQTAAVLYCGTNECDVLNPGDFVEDE